MRTIKVEGLVIGRRNLPNQDRIIIFFSQELGKIILLGKNIKKITSKRLPHVQTGNYLQVSVEERHGIYYLQDTNLISAYSQIKKSLAKVNQLYLIFFILNKILPERQMEGSSFLLTRNFLKKLSQEPLNETRLKNYLNELLIGLGYLQEKINLSELLAKTEEIIAEKIPAFII